VRFRWVLLLLLVPLALGVLAGDGVSTYAQTDTHGDTIPDAGDACPLAPEDIDGFDDSDGCPDIDTHDDSVAPADTGNALAVFGPAPVQMGETLGRYMYVTGYVKNLGLHIDEVAMSLGVSALPTGCSANYHTMLPVGHFALHAGENKPVVFRAPFEGNSSASQGEYPLTVPFSVDHVELVSSAGDEVGATLLNNDVSLPIILTASFGRPTTLSVGESIG
jgi:hypothetical protein